MNTRRAFFGTLLGATVAAATFDPERALWVPKHYSIPSGKELTGTNGTTWAKKTPVEILADVNYAIERDIGLFRGEIALALGVAEWRLFGRLERLVKNDAY